MVDECRSVAVYRLGTLGWGARLHTDDTGADIACTLSCELATVVTPTYCNVPLKNLQSSDILHLRGASLRDESFLPVALRNGSCTVITPEPETLPSNSCT